MSGSRQPKPDLDMVILAPWRGWAGELALCGRVAASCGPPSWGAWSEVHSVARG
jgi:hypothetical protein